MLTKEQANHILEWAKDLDENVDLQGKNYLASTLYDNEGEIKETKYCCLGRACLFINSVTVDDLELEGIPSDINLENRILKHFGFDIENHMFEFDAGEGRNREALLTELNDEGKSFPFIANLLRKYVEDNYKERTNV